MLIDTILDLPELSQEVEIDPQSKASSPLFKKESHIDTLEQRKK